MSNGNWNSELRDMNLWCSVMCVGECMSNGELDQ